MRPLGRIATVVALAATSMSNAAGPVRWQETRTAVSGTAHQALYSIALSGATAVAVGADGQILESADGGKAWRAIVPRPTDSGLFGVAVTEQRQIAVGQLGTILVKKDGLWRKVTSGTDNRLFSVSVSGSAMALAVGAFGTLLRSDDAGLNWRSIAPKWSDFAQDGIEPHIYDVDIGASGVITIVGEFGLILRSSDGGARWILAHKGDASLLALDLKRADGVGYAVGQSATILRTTDHGASWSDTGSRGTSILLGVRSSPDGRVLVTGMRDMLASDDAGTTWRHLRDHDFVSDWYQGLQFTPQGNFILIVGHSGQILRMGSGQL
jgi:photosystem II stability/assembly factor-like uncharacterized protein